MDIARSRVSTDLLSLWDEKEVPEEVQQRLIDANFFTIAKFATLDDDRAGVRRCGIQELGIPGEGLAGRSAVGSLIDAWESAKEYVEVRQEIEAEARATKVPATLVRHDHLNMRKAFQMAWFPIEDQHTPAPSYVEKRFESTTEGDYRVETLKEAFSILEEEGGMENVTADRSGNLVLRRGPKEGTLPMDSEELRSKIKLVMACTFYTKGRFPSRRYFNNLTCHDFDRHVEYILSDRVARLRSKDADGNVVSSPDWSLVLSYEYQIRKKAYEMISMGESETLKESLRMARKDLELKERFLLTPWTVSQKSGKTSRKQARGDRSRSRNRSRSRRNGQGRGGRGGTAKGAGGGSGAKSKGAKKSSKGGGRQPLPQGLKNLPRLTVTGKKEPICFNYNMPGQSCDSKCRRQHVCWWCEGKHAGHTCPDYLKAGGE
jgi:hypothetical protein